MLKLIISISYTFDFSGAIKWYNFRETCYLRVLSYVSVIPKEPHLKNRG